jgi:predicted RNA-binding Zn-ribbon protein involved in translation (DUF1610 family)
VAIYVNKDGGFQQTEVVSRECPHCGAHAQLLPLATPSFDALLQARPRHVGLVFACAACGEPRFVRAAVRSFEAERVELSPNLTEVERARERFQYGYLSADIERLLREAFDCYTAGCYTAFALLSRHAVNAALAGHDGNTRRRWHELLREVLEIAEVDADTTRAIEAAVFGDPHTLPKIGADEAAVLIEAVKDLFYQAYVRTAKLQAAMKMRRFFAGEHARNVTPIDRGRRDPTAKTF